MRLTMLVRCILGVYTDVCQHSDPDVSITYGECNGHSHRRACCVDTRHSACIALCIAVQPMHHAATIATIKSHIRDDLLKLPHHHKIYASLNRDRELEITNRKDQVDLAHLRSSYHPATILN